MKDPIKGVVAIAVDENGNWLAGGFSDDPDGRDATNYCLECLRDDEKTFGMVAVYLKPVEFWPATRETLGNKPLLQNSTDISIIENINESVPILFGDGVSTIDNEIAKAMDKLKSLVRLRAYVKSEMSHYESDSLKTTEDSVKEAMALCNGNGQSVIKHSVERKVEQTHKETVTVTSSGGLADRIFKLLSEKPSTLSDIEYDLDAEGVDDILGRDARFVCRAKKWWCLDSLPTLNHIDGESMLDAYARQLSEFIAKFGPVSQTDANKILKMPVSRIAAIRKLPQFASDGSYRIGFASEIPEDQRYSFPREVEVEPVQTPDAELEETPPANQVDTSVLSDTRDGPVETPQDNLVSLDDQFNPVDRSVDQDDPNGYTATEIETYIRKCVRQNQNGMMLISDIANNMGIGEAAVSEVVRSMSDMSYTGNRVLLKLVK